MKTFFAAIFALGVGSAVGVMPECEENYVKNPFADVCQCPEQIFTQDNCTQAFWCVDSVTNTGCRLTCGEDQFVQFDFATGEMLCGDIASHPHSRCPGNFKLNCPDDDVGSDFTAEEDCDWCPNGGFTMNNDCTEAFTCYSLLYPTAGRGLKCPSGSKVAVDFYTLEWECVPADDQCPGLGGYRLGCPEDVPSNPEPVEITNPYGTCECAGQFFSNDDCTEGFFCSEEDFEGVGMQWICGEDQIIRPNFLQNTVVCINQVEGQQCPGDFSVSCTDIGELNQDKCECDGQLWMNSDCTEGFSCYSRIAGGGRELSCPAGQVLNIDITAYSWDCVYDTGHCPGLGGFSLGACDGSWEGTVPPPAETTTTSTTTTAAGETTTTAEGGSSEKVLSSVLLAAVMIIMAI